MLIVRASSFLVIGRQSVSREGEGQQEKSHFGSFQVGGIRKGENRGESDDATGSNRTLQTSSIYLDSS
jgi:hypothetical protein